MNMIEGWAEIVGRMRMPARVLAERTVAVDKGSVLEVRIDEGFLPCASDHLKQRVVDELARLGMRKKVVFKTLERGSTTTDEVII